MFRILCKAFENIMQGLNQESFRFKVPKSQVEDGWLQTILCHKYKDFVWQIQRQIFSVKSKQEGWKIYSPLFM